MEIGFEKKNSLNWRKIKYGEVVRDALRGPKGDGYSFFSEILPRRMKHGYF